MFGIGFGVQAVLKLLRALSKLLSQPSALLQALKHSDNFKLGAFLGSYVAIFKVSEKCLFASAAMIPYNYMQKLHINAATSTGACVDCDVLTLPSGRELHAALAAGA